MITFDKPSWADELDCAVTLCDTEGRVCYQNDRSRAVKATSGAVRYSPATTTARAKSSAGCSIPAAGTSTPFRKRESAN